jgi:hypothetical protein
MPTRVCRETGRFQGLCLLSACNRQRALEVCFGLHRVQLGGLAGNFTGDSMNFRFAPHLAGHFNRRCGLAYGVPSTIELGEVRIGYGQAR